MALPSSPPLIADDIDLPYIATFGPLAANSDVPVRPLQRKRQHSDYGSLSSDPLFSDTTEEDGEGPDIQRPRRKKVVQGPWWYVGRRSRQDLRRRMARKDNMRAVDSGVWMGSDASEDSVDSVMSSQQRMQAMAVGDHNVVEDKEADGETTMPSAIYYATRVVQDCVDRGKEVVHLGDLALNHISDATLRPLHQLIKSSFTDITSPPSEDEFGPFTPSITLILSTNQLTSLPAELFNLRNITVLSLRNNLLSHIPPAIARLDRLQELNIASNNIRYLPWELVGAFERTVRITVRPNPFLDPTDWTGCSLLPRQDVAADSSAVPSALVDARDTVEEMRRKYLDEGCLNLRGELELRLKLGRMLRTQHLRAASQAGQELHFPEEELIYLASSAVRYMGVDGTPVRPAGAITLPRDMDWSATMDPTAHRPSSSGSTTVPSLFELALRAIQSTNDLSEFLPERPATSAADYALSPSLTSAFRQAAINTATHGNESCSTCGRKYVVARAEWMEYWYHGYPSQQLGPEATLPFLRKACSWDCARPSEAGTFRCSRYG
ncbi:hypothetical protein LTR62_001345 [Meristemomyces frigidus]|uniref:Uncharacterized protein n=1 Tax=Meristemomyces frigidus TaxID=1508187 RepID=A0AAN7YBS1_9PEZI|nr:hypothetical protein LTR62_001345 [Meristemomyces frigidus]